MNNQTRTNIKIKITPPDPLSKSSELIGQGDDRKKQTNKWIELLSHGAGDDTDSKSEKAQK
jgi:hypothetical protein